VTGEEGGPAPRRHILTVAVEDYFHVGAFNRLIQQGEWYRFESRLDRSVRLTLDLLDECRTRATFFTLGWVAESLPEVVRLIADRGHDVASKGFYHRSIREMAPEEFREDLARAREAIERASGRRVLGYRVADRWFEIRDLWALEVLAQEGYAYDSSVAPMIRRYAPQPWREMAHQNRLGDRVIWELPLSATSILGLRVPIAGGNYFRQFPRWFLRRALASWIRENSAPFVMYFHTWEVDGEQPRITAASRLERLRHYRNLERMPETIRYFLQRYRFTSAEEYLGLAPAAASASPKTREAITVSHPAAKRAGNRVPLTVVIPCYNEELILPYLANTLRSVEEKLGERYAFHFAFVDDASADGTWAALQRIFGSRPDCTLLRNDANLGVAGTIQRGIRAASTEVVASIDCDCTYDPHELGRMVALLTEGVDLVTASPYHPEGKVRNVPGWRLALSRMLSRLYRLVLHNKLHTYTSCFRVYRRDVAAAVPVERHGFLGVAEMLARMDLAGSLIAEFPTTLEVRLLGRSKMRTARAIVGHIGLFLQMVLLRMRRRGGTRPGRAVAPEAALRR
jgi:polysaccharide deacetylase family protein (PEP-CTERM system associated)